MRIAQRLAAAVACAWLVFASPALASQATLVTPGSPLPMSSLASFLNAAFLSIGSCNSGTSAPANGTGAAAFAGECWINTTSNPWVFSYTADGTHWSEFGTLNTSTFVWTPYNALVPGNNLSDVSSASTALNNLFGTIAANYVWAGPTSGSAANPSARKLVGADLPSPAASTLGGIESLTCASHQWLYTISTSGVPACGQPGFSDLSGALATSQLPGLPSADIWVGNGSGAAAAVSVSGDCTISNAGVLTCTKTSGTAFGPFATQASPCTTAQGCFGANESSATGIAQFSSGTSSVSTALANGTTATTQNENDTSTKLATDAFVTSIASLPALATVGTIGTGIWQGSNVGLGYGGTSASLTASNGGIVYSTASALAILAGTATAGQCLLSGATAAPTWGSCSGAAAVSSVSNSDGTLTVSPTTGAVVASLNPAHANNYSGAQTGQIYASGSVNKFRNGTMDIAQRGTSVSIGTSGNYGLDGWKAYFTGSTSVTAVQAAASTCSSSGTVPMTEDVQEIEGATSNTDILVGQRIESYIAAPLAGETVTVQFKFCQDTGSAVTPNFKTCYASAQDNFGTCTADISSTAITSCASSTWCIESYTFTASASARNGYEVDFDCNAAFTVVDKDCFIADADIRVTPGVPTGTNANPPPPEFQPIAAELAQCQRYYENSNGNTSTILTGTHTDMINIGQAYSVGSSALNAMGLSFKVTKRTAPSVTLYDGAGNSGAASEYVAGSWNDNATTPLSTVTIGLSNVVIYNSTRGSGGAVAQFVHFVASAEL